MEEKAIKSLRNSFRKYSLEELEEQYERQFKILKNSLIIKNLPDKGKQVQLKAEEIGNEIASRKAVLELEEKMNKLLIEPVEDVLKERHVRYVCSLEKSPKKDRYKPGSTLNKSTFKENPTKLIPLRESMALQAKQVNTLPPSQVRLNIEGTERSTENEEADVIDLED